MKKLMFFFIIIFSISVFPQISPTVFPKIGYADLYWLQKSRGTNYADSSYYYPRLRQLGLNYVTSYTDNNTKTPTLNNGIKILDNAFPRDAYWTYNNPFKYANATGDYIYHFPYEAGGSNIAVLTTQSHNFGFGNTSGNSSWWIYPYDSECIGDINKSDTQGGETHIVHFAQVGVNNPGILLKAKPDAEHFPYDVRWDHIYNLRLRILARIDGSPGTVNVARVHVWEQTPSMLAGTGTSAGISSNEGIQNLMMESQTGKSSTPNMSVLTLTDYIYYITADNFGGTNYVELVSPSTFRKTGGSSTELYVTIEWLGTRSLYVDKIAIYSTYYDDLFIANSITVRNTIKSDLEGLFGSVKTHQSFAHPYNDEPYPMMYRAVGEVSSLSETQLGTGKYVNGATRDLTVDRLMLANSQRRLPYVLYDLYSITPYYDSASTGTNSIQDSWDYLINNSEGNVGYGVERYKGIKQAIQMAQNYTPDNTSDDVPFYHTIQTSAQKDVSNGVVTNVRFREPRYYEVLAQGNLALCYGAKGMMYFLIMTNALYTSVGEPNYYGLFEESGNIGGIVQNPFNPQVSNYRFNAVQKLNQYIDKISSEVLQLTWRNGYSIHKGQLSGTYISNISSATTGGVTDASGSTYVELGTFKKTSDFSNTNLEYFMVVNRRVLSSETRKITITFNKSSSYTTWKVREVGTDNYWIVSNTGSFQASYAPGEGKLFKFEPLFLNSTETFSNATVVVNNSITVPSGKTLSISQVSSFSFGSSISLLVNGTLTAQGSSANNIVFTRSGSSGYWGGIQYNSGSSGNLQYCTIQYATNGIYCYNSSPYIAYCHVQNNQDAGVNLYYYSNSSLYYNTIQNNYSGVVCGDHSSPSLLYPGHNVIRSNNAVGVAASYYSNPQIGSTSSGYGNNSIYNNSSSISAHIYCTINAQNNYWGGGNPVVYTSENSVVNYLPILTTDPNAGRAAIAVNNTPETTAPVSLSMLASDDDLTNALDKEKDKKYDEAISLFLKVFKNNKDGLLGSYALCKIEECFTQSGRKDYIDYSGKEIKSMLKEGTETYVEALELETHQMLNAGSYQNAIDNLLTILKKYNLNSAIEKNTLFNLGAFYGIFLGDTKSSDEYFNGLKVKYPDDELVKRIDVIKSMGVVTNATAQAASASGLYKEAETETENNTGSDISNYPNPFNPSTKISFSIPRKDVVKLKVFDVLGREIATLANDVYEAGKYEVEFNASNLPSGIYESVKYFV